MIFSNALKAVLRIAGVCCCGYGCIRDAAAKPAPGDAICREKRQEAQRQVKEGHYSVWVSGLPGRLAPYAEDMFRIYYGKQVNVTNTDFLMCGTGLEDEECYNRYMDSAVAAFGTNVFERVRRSADSLYAADPLRHPSMDAPQPEFPGGPEALGKALQQHIHYPPAAKRDSVQGKVYVKADMDTTGTIVRTTVVRGVRADLDSAAVAGVQALPAFIPPSAGGRKMRSSFLIPVSFKLN